MDGEPSPQSRANAFLPHLICCLLIAIFAALSYSATRTKCATYDEPFHALGDWFKLRLGDFRLDYGSPALSSYLGALLNGREAIRVDFNSDDFKRLPVKPHLGWNLTMETLYRTPGNDGAAFVDRGRMTMLPMAIGAAILTIIWAWQLAGPLAGVIAAALFCLDPNLIGHASLVKNDLMMTFCMTGTFMAVWSIGKRLTILNVSMLAIAMLCAMNTKSSAAMLWTMLIILLAIRARMPSPWNVMGREIASRGKRILPMIVVVGICAVVSYAGTWACYGFRFNPTPDPTVVLDTTVERSAVALARFDAMIPVEPAPPLDTTTPLPGLIAAFERETDAFADAIARGKQGLAKSGIPADILEYLTAAVNQMSSTEASAREVIKFARQPQQSEGAVRESIREARGAFAAARRMLQMIDHWIAEPNGAPDWILNLGDFMLAHRIMPAAWINGVVLQYLRAHWHPSFFLGQVRDEGTWLYFPVAILVKSPVASLIAIFLALGIGIRFICAHWAGLGKWVWSLSCLLVPVVVYFVPAMLSNLNIGLRYVFPIYPFVFIAVAVLLSWRLRQASRRPVFVRTLTVLSVLLAAETLWAWPNYISFFNLAVGGSHGGINYLADSNLDWGQDLPLLAQWQKAHADVPLALAYFGTVDPAFYGIQSVPLTSSSPPQLRATHVIAISATHLQGVYESGFTGYREIEPTEILGGTIYLYDLRRASK